MTKSGTLNVQHCYNWQDFVTCRPLRKWISKKLGQTYLLDAEYDIKGGNLSGQKQMKARDQAESNNRQFNEGRATQREKQKQKVQQYFAQQNHNEFQEYMQHKEKKQRSDSPRKEAGKVRGIENKSPKPNKKQHYSILVSNFNKTLIIFSLNRWNFLQFRCSLKCF